jgi:hypothetical protein
LALLLVLLVLLVLGVGAASFSGGAVGKFLDPILNNDVHDPVATSTADHISETTTTSSGAAGWSGTWLRQRSTNFDSSSLITSKEGNDTLAFSIVSVNGNVGEIEAHAKIRGNTAEFIAEPDEENYDGSRCHLQFTLAGDLVTVREATPCSHFQGNTVYFDGTYERNGVALEITTKDSALFKRHTEAYFVFKSLVGSDLEKFDLSMGQSVGFDEEVYFDPNLQADVEEFFVYHVGSRAIIAVSADNRIWAAVWDYDSALGEVFFYYTNVPQYQNSLPAAFEKWREGEGTVFYLSGKDKGRK